MGTGTPTVTTSGIAAANAILKKYKKAIFAYQKEQENYVRIIDKPVTKDKLFAQYSEDMKQIMGEAMRCRLCEHPSCTKTELTDVRGIMRRVSVGNMMGAKKCWQKAPVSPTKLEEYEKNCICVHQDGQSVAIRKIIEFLGEVKP
jgi:prolycopene isomerase